MLFDTVELAEAEIRFGVPEQMAMEQVVNQEEMELVASSLRRLRTHDVTFFIMDEDRLAVIRKPMFARGVLRAPSGGIRSGESVEAGAVREAWEETGLEIRLERYLLRIYATFYPPEPWPGSATLPPEVADPDDPNVLHWWTHVFQASVLGRRQIEPVDTDEIAEARWATLEELQGPIRDALIATSLGLFRYRVALTDAAVALLR
jgi:8-oxo-dGTP pyrophosphatase MutT (NUDIX family)